MIFETYSKRKRARERAGQPDVYQYAVLPHPLRVQLVQIFIDVIGNWSDHAYDSKSVRANNSWTRIRKAVATEQGKFHLNSQYEDPCTDCANFLLKCTNTDEILDLIDFALRWIDSVLRDAIGEERADNAIADVNTRFKEQGVGFEYVAGELIEIRSEYIHAEVVKPAIALLQSKRFEGALAEFMTAFEHFRHQRYKEAVTDALKAFESTMKTIISAKKWKIESNAAAAKLIECVFANNLIPSHLQSEFTALRGLLMSGVPTVRNRGSGHGQGETVVEMPDYIASFALHVTAANIVLLVQAAKL